MIRAPRSGLVLASAFVLFVSLPGQVHAQDMRSDGQPAARFGMRLGLTSSTFHGGDPHFHITATFDRNARGERLGGLEAVVFVRNPISTVLDMQMELGYTRRGSRQFSDGLGSRWEETYRFGYVHSALLLQIRPGGASRDGLGLSMGPYAHMLVTGRATDVRIDDDDGERRERTDDVDTLNRGDWGFVLGADYTFASRYILDLRFVLGLRSFVNEEKLGPIAQSQQASIYNTAFIIGLGVML